MLRVGLTGGLGSGKSTTADLFQSLGAQVIKADTIGRDLMRPGHDVYQQIIGRFGASVVNPDGELNRPALARLVFEGDGAAEQLDALNAIVHPAVIAVQMEWLAELEQRIPNAIAIVESALIFETKYAKDMRTFDRVILVTAPDDLKIARFVDRTASTRKLTDTERSSLESDARHRLAQQIPDTEKAARCDFILDNSGTLAQLDDQVRRIYAILTAEAGRPEPHSARPISLQ